MIEHYGVQVQPLGDLIYELKDRKGSQAFFYHTVENKILGPNDTVPVNELDKVKRINPGLSEATTLHYIAVIGGDNFQFLLISNRRNTRVVLFTQLTSSGAKILMERPTSEPILGLCELVNYLKNSKPEKGNKDQANLFLMLRYAEKLLELHSEYSKEGSLSSSQPPKTIVKAIYRDDN